MIGSSSRSSPTARVDRLARLLPLLVEQADGIGADVLVVDNDPAGSAAPARRGPSGPLRPRAAAGHRRRAQPGARRGRRRRGAGVHRRRRTARRRAGWATSSRPGGSGPAPRCRGRCAPSSPSRRRRGCEASGAFERRRRPSGTVVAGAPTNNLLLDLGRIRALGLEFDERFGLTGGEDTMFSHDLAAPRRRDPLVRRGRGDRAGRRRSGPPGAGCCAAAIGPGRPGPRWNSRSPARPGCAPGSACPRVRSAGSRSPPCALLSPRAELRARAQVEIVSCAGMLARRVRPDLLRVPPRLSHAHRCCRLS